MFDNLDPDDPAVLWGRLHALEILLEETLFLVLVRADKPVELAATLRDRALRATRSIAKADSTVAGVAMEHIGRICNLLMGRFPELR